MSAKLRLHAAPATFVSFAVILAFSAAGLVALSSASTSRSRAAGARRRAPAASPQPRCGDTITTDTTLHHDLVNCPNNGILIGADGITLNLNGHTIDGDGTPAAGCNPVKDFCDIGVANFSHDGVTVKQGSMRQLEAGVDLFQAPHNRLLDLSASRNRRVGFVLFESFGSLVKNSSANSLPHEGVGVLLFDSNRVRVLDNSFRNDTLSWHLDHPWVPRPRGPQPDSRSRKGRHKRRRRCQAHPAAGQPGDPLTPRRRHRY